MKKIFLLRNICTNFQIKILSPQHKKQRNRRNSYKKFSMRNSVSFEFFLHFINNFKVITVEFVKFSCIFLCWTDLMRILIITQKNLIPYSPFNGTPLFPSKIFLSHFLLVLEPWSYHFRFIFE